VLTLALILFAADPNAVGDFSILTCCCLGIGFCTTAFYVFYIREGPLSKIASELELKYRETLGAGAAMKAKKEEGGGKQWSDWLKEG